MGNQQEYQKSRKRFNSVKTKLIATMTVLAIVPMASLGVVTNQYTQKAMKKDIAANTLQVTEEVSHGIDNFFLGVESQINLLADNINFTEFKENPNNAEYGSYLLEGTLKSRQNYQSVYFASAQKDFLLSPKQELPAGYDPTVRPWFTDAVSANGKVTISEPYQDATTKKMVITASKAVIHNGVITGVIGIDLDISKLTEDINKIVIGKKGYAFILARDGTALTYNDPKVIGTKEQTKLKLWQDMKNKTKGHSEYTYKGEGKFSTFLTNKRTGWKIVSTLKEQEIKDSTKPITYISSILMIIFALLSIGVAYLFGRSIANKVNQIQKAFKKASEGDLTTRVHVKTNDEFKDLESDFNHMMEQLSTSLGEVEKSSMTVLKTSSSLAAMTSETTTAVYEVTQAISEIANGATQQADYAQTSQAETSQLSERLDGISNSVNEMFEMSKQSTELSHKGLEQVQLLTEKSSETKVSTSKVDSIVKEVESRMEDINTILETISGITDQTNLLSLNASIESARAGEHGRGFAVVANEVRKLAEQSKASAIEIKQLIDNIKSVVKQAVIAMEQTHHVVGEQEVVVNETKVIFNEIIESIKEMVMKSDQVKDSVLESQQNKEMVMNAIESITDVSQEAAAGSEQVSASAEEISATMEEFSRHASGLQTLSEQLENEIKKFKLN
ncbi:methyl-accepting chemotaxis protein [Gottfriedia luciferensis]|uniref:methyl-accepting chemotaxis protein n=1 Tax=Gottfriedia luciferensis TaxID=178774 RepID=UPI000B449F9C|nr:methyl-accepting chemotaxis protein [Gottfriedia luciferensis]